MKSLRNLVSGRTARRLVLALGLGAVAVTTAVPAYADWRDDRARHDRDWREHHWHDHYPVYVGPGYAYAPPPVVYAPPPPPPGINLVIPLHIR
ncbi:MAG TPA: hypothetical protein VMC10_17360 [Stellaceae bacterium]|nr:hypothetical protein [Stellaceae bacterium]